MLKTPMLRTPKFGRLLLTGLSALPLILACTTAPAAIAPPAQLDAFLDYDYAAGLTAPKSGGRFAWSVLRKGRRNVWVAEGPGFNPRKLTDGTSDDGQDIGELVWSDDGSTLAWTRGGVEHNGWASGASANPASAVVQPTTEIWVSVRGGKPVRVAEGEEPALSATGRLAYIKDGQVWTVDTAGGAKPVKTFYDRGRIGNISWSPDGQNLVFVSRRGNHSFIGVYGGADAPITWLAPSTRFDGDPVWSPDGSSIAFSRRPGVADVLANEPTESPSPFAIWVGSVADGSARQVWQSPNTLNGSFPQLPDGLFLMWGKGDRLTFRAELDGWGHLYSLPVAGGEPTLLTPGPFLVEHVSMTPDGKALLYDANSGKTEGDIDRRHVFRVAVDRPGPVALTSGLGGEWTAIAVGDKLAYLGATVSQPPRAMLVDANGARARSLSAEGDYHPAAFVVPKSVTFTAADGTVVHGQLFNAGGKAKQPGLIFVHGGPTRQMLLGWSYMDYYTHSYMMNQYLATHGYTVLSVNYRLGIGYGRAFQHALNAGASGNSEYQDVVAGAHFLQALPNVDGSRLGIWGGSYGGLLTGQALARDSDLFKAGVDFHGVHDWSLYPGGGAPQRYEQGRFEEARKLAFESSPEAAMKGWRSPVLLIHGDDDRNVRFDQTVDIARRLDAQHTPYEELILPNEVHGFLRYDSWLRADSATVRFLDKNLKR
jgi:dipeptidyl aminopeptidase/acylaminoacyl peptidase